MRRFVIPLAAGGLMVAPDDAESASIPGFAKMYAKMVKEGPRRHINAGTLEPDVFEQAVRAEPGVQRNSVYVGAHAGEKRDSVGDMTPEQVGHRIAAMLDSGGTTVVPNYPSRSGGDAARAGHMLFLDAGGEKTVAPFMAGRKGDVMLKTVFEPNPAQVASIVDGISGGPLSSMSGLQGNALSSAQPRGLSAVEQPSTFGVNIGELLRAVKDGKASLAVSGGAAGGLMASPESAWAGDRTLPPTDAIEEAWNPVEALAGGLGGGIRAALMGVPVDALMDYGMGKIGGLMGGNSGPTAQDYGGGMGWR